MELLPTREVVARLGISASTLSRWVAAGRITPTMRGAGIRGGMWFWPRDVDALQRELEIEHDAKGAAS